MVEFDDIYYIRRIKAGDTNAFVHIVHRYQRMVITIVRKILVRQEEAEDISQEVFIKVFQSINKFREESSFSTWLYRIAYNTTISELRKRKHKFMAIENSVDTIRDEELSDSIDNISVDEKLKYLDIVLQKLPPDDAFIISLFYLENHKIHDIGAIIGNTEANVKVRLHRIRKFMNFEINKLMQQ